MKRVALVAVVLIPTILLACSPQAPVTSSPIQEVPVASETPVSTPTVSIPSFSPTPSSPPTTPSPSTTFIPPASSTLTQTKSLPPLDAFMKGFNFADWNQVDKPRPPLAGPLYGSPLSDLRLKDLAATGTNWSGLVVSVFEETEASTEITRKQYATASDQALRHMIDLAHNLGMRVMLKVWIAIEGGTGVNHSRIGTLFSTEDQWQDWFASYRQIIVYYATLAQDAGVDMFSIGYELNNTSQREADWRRIAQEVRQVYKGPITYQSAVDANPLLSEELQIKWWDAVDYIGVDGYYPLTQSNNPTVEELKSAWVNKGYLSRLEGLSQKFQKPIVIMEIGYASSDGINTWPVQYLRAAQQPLDLQEQADCYQAAFEVLWGKPWLKGIFWWQWMANPVIWPGGPTDKSYFPYGKPAEEVLRKFYLSQ